MRCLKNNAFAILRLLRLILSRASVVEFYILNLIMI